MTDGVRRAGAGGYCPMSLCSHSGHDLSWLMQVVDGAGASGSWASTSPLRATVIVSSIRIFIGVGRTLKIAIYAFSSISLADRTAPMLKEKRKVLIAVERSLGDGLRKGSWTGRQSHRGHASETPRALARHCWRVDGTRRNLRKRRRRSARIRRG